MNRSGKYAQALANYFRIVTRSLIHRRIRTVLTVTGIVISISIVLTLVFLGNGLRNSVASQLQQFGSDLIFVMPFEAGNPMSRLLGGGEFKQKHIDAMEEVSGVMMAMPIIDSHLIKGEFLGEEKTISLRAQSRDFITHILEQSQGIHLKEGAWPASDEAREVAVGASIAEKGFKEDVRVGDTIDIRGRRFTVSGIVGSIGEQTQDNSVYITLEMFKRLTGLRDGYKVAVIKTEPGVDLDTVAADLSDVLADQKGLDDYSVATPEKAAEIADNVIGTIEAALLLIAAVAVIVGGIGIMNTMYTSVLERTRQIGIMKSVGAKRSHVLMVFLVESSLIGLIGGFLGIVVGAGFAEIVVLIAQAKGFLFFDAAMDLKTIVFVLAFTLTVGLIAGVLPARQAALKRPVEALRYR